MRLRLALVALVAMPALEAHAATVNYIFDTPVETKTTARPLDEGGGFRLDGLFKPPSAVTHEFTFTAGSANAISLSNVWLSGAPADLFRLVGVNIDLLDSTNTIVASDDFIGAADGQAFSTLSYAGLVPGAAYTVALTGTNVGTGRYRIDASTLPVAPAPEAIVPGPDAVLFQPVFDTRESSKDLIAPLPAGQGLRAEAIVSELAPGGVDNTLAFTLTEGRDFASAFTWITSVPPLLGTVGFNTDLLDSGNNVIASDVFQGVTDGQAFSTLETFLAPGAYRLVTTATSAGPGTRYRIDVAEGAEAPTFVPIPGGEPPVAPVPLPASGLLVVSGLLALAGWRHWGRRAA